MADSRVRTYFVSKAAFHYLLSLISKCLAVAANPPTSTLSYKFDSGALRCKLIFFAFHFILSWY